LTTYLSYDHLDWPTIEDILKVRGPHVQFLVPLGNKQWFVDAGIEGERVHEMDWWESLVLTRLASGGPIRTTFICCPAQHGSGAYSIIFLSLWYANATHYVRIQVVESWINGRRCGPVGLCRRVGVQYIMLGESTPTILSTGKMLTDRFSDTGYMTENGPCPAFKGEGESHKLVWPRFTDSV